MRQTKLQSFIEANTNVIVGYFISVFIGHWLYPAVGCDFPLTTNAFVTGCFVFAGLIRSYTIRRLHDWWNHRRDT